MNEWIAILMGVAITLLSGAISYGISNGVTKTRINGIAARLYKLEADKYISREEYESRHKDVIDMLKTLKD